MKNKRFATATCLCAAIGVLLWRSPAFAEMVLSQVIVDLQPGKPNHTDIEVWNNGPDRMYVVALPSEIKAPGTPDEHRVTEPNPSVSGLLVTPQRIVLEPDQRRVIRVSAISPRGDTDRIYRVTIKPVAGSVTASSTALKVLFGYDVLVLYRPSKVTGDIRAERLGRRFTIHNDSNTAQELFDGKQCNSAGKLCQALPARRLYAGAAWEQNLVYDTPVEYQVTSGNGASLKKF